MSEKVSSSPRRFFVAFPVTFYVAVALGLAIWFWPGDEGQESSRPVAVRAPAAPTPAQVCENNRESMLTDYREKMAQSLYWPASTVLRPCAVLLKDQDLLELVRVAETEDAARRAQDKSLGLYERLNAIRRIEEAAPARAPEFSRLKAQLEKAFEQEQRRQRQAEAAKRRSEGVRLGMSAEDVLASSWGKPERINRSIYTFGVHEQWVYGGRNYLYFKDGVLDSIQVDE